MRRFLVVGNQSLGSEPLRAAIHERLAGGACQFHVLVPATPTHEHLAWTEGEATAVARRRLDEALAWMRAEGAIASGSVGDANPVLAVTDALRARRISTRSSCRRCRPGCLGGSTRISPAASPATPIFP